MCFSPSHTCIRLDTYDTLDKSSNWVNWKLSLLTSQLHSLYEQNLCKGFISSYTPSSSVHMTVGWAHPGHPLVAWDAKYRFLWNHLMWLWRAVRLGNQCVSPAGTEMNPRIWGEKDVHYGFLTLRLSKCVRFQKQALCFKTQQGFFYRYPSRRVLRF